MKIHGKPKMPSPRGVITDEQRRAPLPKPTAEFVSSGDYPSSDEKVRGLVCNPIYTGLGPFPALVSDEQWVHAATLMIREDGAAQFLVNVLHVLRATFDGYSLVENDDLEPSQGEG
jgi:hypothetical protein